MSVLTKVFVILVTVFSVMLVAVVVTFVVNQENQSTALSHSQSRARLAENKAKALQAEQESHQAQVDVQMGKLHNEISLAKDQLTRQEEQATQDNVALVNARRDNSRLKAEIGQLVASQNILAETSWAQHNELKALRTNAGKLGAEVVLLSDQLAAMTTERNAVIRDLRTTKEALAAISDDYDKLWALAEQHGWSPGDEASQEKTIRSQTRIDGMVTAVEVVESGDVYLQVNIGSTDGVQPNMEFVVFNRGKGGVKYKGTMIVRGVDNAESSGIMKIVERDQKIVEGDLIFSGLSTTE